MSPVSKETKEKRERSIRTKKFLYYLDEILVLLSSTVAVIFTDAIQKRAMGKQAGTGDIMLDWVNVIISAIMAIITYGSMYTKFKYNDESKPPLPKRVANAMLQGIAWQNIVSSIK